MPCCIQKNPTFHNGAPYFCTKVTSKQWCSIETVSKTFRNIQKLASTQNLTQEVIEKKVSEDMPDIKKINHCIPICEYLP